MFNLMLRARFQKQYIYKETEFCQKLKFSYPYIFAAQWCRYFIF